MGNKVDISKLNKIFVLFVSIYISVYYAFLIFFNGNEDIKMIITDGFFFIGTMIGAICIFYAYKKNRGADRKFWFIIFLAIFSYIIAEVIWGYYDNILRISIPLPAISDFFQLAFPILLMIALLYLIYTQMNLLDSLKLFFDILVIMTVITTLSYQYLIEPYFSNTTLSLYGKIVSSAFPIADLGLLFGMISLTLIAKKIPRKLLGVVALGLLVFTIADATFLYFISHDENFSGTLIDPVWTLSFLILGLAGLIGANEKHVVNLDKKNSEESKSKTLNNFKVFIPYIPLLILLIILFSKIRNIDSIAIGSILAITLVLIRQFLIIFENKVLVELLEKSNKELAEKKNILERKHEKLKKASVTMEKEARTDFLTELYNRRYVNEYLGNLIEESKKNKKQIAIFLLDIDNFKKINDSNGHEVGDMLLQRISTIMKENTRSSEIIGRLGGDEFIGILPEVELDMAKLITERIRKQVEANTLKINDKEIKTTVSIGITYLVNGNDSIKSAMSRADEALYIAKGKGRNRVCIYNNKRFSI